MNYKETANIFMQVCHMYCNSTLYFHCSLDFALHVLYQNPSCTNSLLKKTM